MVRSGMSPEPSLTLAGVPRALVHVPQLAQTAAFSSQSHRDKHSLNRASTAPNKLNVVFFKGGVL